MIVYNLTCNVDLEVEKQWVEWVDLQLGQMSKSDRINNTYLLKLNSNSPSKGSIYALQYLISNQETLQNFLNNEDQILKEQIRLAFGETVLHFSSQLEIIKQY